MAGVCSASGFLAGDARLAGVVFFAGDAFLTGEAFFDEPVDFCFGTFFAGEVAFFTALTTLAGNDSESASSALADCVAFRGDLRNCGGSGDAFAFAVFLGDGLFVFAIAYGD